MIYDCKSFCIVFHWYNDPSWIKWKDSGFNVCVSVSMQHVQWCTLVLHFVQACNIEKVCRMSGKNVVFQHLICIPCRTAIIALELLWFWHSLHRPDNFIHLQNLCSNFYFYISCLKCKYAKPFFLPDKFRWCLDFSSCADLVYVCVCFTGRNVCGLYYRSGWQSVTIIRGSPALFASRSPEQERKSKR